MVNRVDRDTQAILESLKDLLTSDPRSLVLNEIREAGVETFEDFLGFCEIIQDLWEAYALKPIRPDCPFDCSDELGVDSPVIMTIRRICVLQAANRPFYFMRRYRKDPKSCSVDYGEIKAFFTHNYEPTSSKRSKTRRSCAARLEKASAAPKKSENVSLVRKFFDAHKSPSSCRQASSSSCKIVKDENAAPQPKRTASSLPDSRLTESDANLADRPTQEFFTSPTTNFSRSSSDHQTSDTLKMKNAATQVEPSGSAPDIAETVGPSSKILMVEPGKVNIQKTDIFRSSSRQAPPMVVKKDSAAHRSELPPPSPSVVDRGPILSHFSAHFFGLSTSHPRLDGEMSAAIDPWWISGSFSTVFKSRKAVGGTLDAIDRFGHAKPQDLRSSYGELHIVPTATSSGLDVYSIDILTTFDLKSLASQPYKVISAIMGVKIDALCTPLLDTYRKPPLVYERPYFEHHHGRMMLKNIPVENCLKKRLIVREIPCKASSIDMTLNKHVSPSISHSQLFRDAWNFHIDCDEECIIFEDLAHLETNRADFSKHGERSEGLSVQQGTLRASLFAQLLEEHDMGTLLRPPGAKISFPKLQVLKVDDKLLKYLQELYGYHDPAQLQQLILWMKSWYYHSSSIVPKTERHYLVSFLKTVEYQEYSKLHYHTVCLSKQL